MKSLIISFVITFFFSTVYAKEKVTTLTEAEQVNVEVTVYNSNLGLVKDTRKVALPRGTGELRFMDVAASIRPETVLARSVSAATDFTVLEQNYEYDLISERKLLDKYVGKTIKIIDWNKFADRKETVEATLLSNNEGQVYKIGDEIYLGHPGIKVLPEIPENLISKPTLTWLYENRSKKPQNLEASYLTYGISWKADYILVLDELDRMADLSAWVTINNQSGATYKDASLKLVAGKINQVAGRQRVRRYKGEIVTESAYARDAFQEEAFFEYHLYDLQRRTTIKDRQTKQISLLEAAGLKVKKEYIVRGARHYYRSRYSVPDQKQPVEVIIKFKNSKDNSLGMPLPGGVIRLYKKDKSGGMQLAGEDKVAHTPKDEEVKLKAGEAFDVVAERKQTDYRRLTSNLHVSEWEVTLRNHKKEAVTVSVVEPLYGNWAIIESSHDYKKEDAFTLRFDVKVPKDGEVKVTYRVKVGLD